MSNNRTEHSAAVRDVRANFINLTTVHASARGLEVGVRKAIGATRNQLTTQFLLESLLVAFSAAVIVFVTSRMISGVLSAYLGVLVPEPAGSRKNMVFQSWQPCGVRSWEMEDETEKLGKVRWTAQELLSSWELAAEGRAMNHCVVSYSNQCADGNTAVWSICAHRADEAEREGVLTAALDIKSQTVTQARGRYNTQANKSPKSAQAKKEGQTGYFELLDRSNVVLNLWMQRERLKREG